MTGRRWLCHPHPRVITVLGLEARLVVGGNRKPSHPVYDSRSVITRLQLQTPLYNQPNACTISIHKLMQDWLPLYRDRHVPGVIRGKNADIEIARVEYVGDMTHPRQSSCNGVAAALQGGQESNRSYPLGHLSSTGVLEWSGFIRYAYTSAIASVLPRDRVFQSQLSVSGLVGQDIGGGHGRGPRECATCVGMQTLTTAKVGAGWVAPAFEPLKPSCVTWSAG